MARSAIAGVLLLAACQRSGRPPRPAALRPVRPPSPVEVALAEAQGAEELARWSRERDERWMEAVDPGEQAEHARRIRAEEIAAGRVSVADLFRQGEAIFERRFTLREGLGTGLLGRPRPALSRVENAAALGGPDAVSCAECHGRGGEDGHGELHQRAWLDGDGRHVGSARPRLPSHLAGLGLVERLAAEMTADLSAQVEQGRAIARLSGAPNRVLLETKGVAFGEVTAGAAGALDVAGLGGVDPDLVVKPFGWKGTAASLRTFVRRALPQHMGLEPPPEGGAPGGARSDVGGGGGEARAGGLPDGDRDGVADELHEGQLTSLVAYLALLDVPVVLPPGEPAAERAWSRGASRFREVGCAECHRPELPLRSPRLEDRGSGLAIDLVRDSQVPPRLEQADPVRPLAVRLYSDLRRHDLGSALAERVERGVAASVFVTRPLWGLGDRGGYYLHDGRARSLREAILLHGGEARAVTERYARLSGVEAREMEVFLLSLRRMPQGRIRP